jgi:crotonobetainyl-CoA:carnitine CoA-transferase CaiB-like acyl-CoA transferase
LKNQAPSFAPPIQRPSEAPLALEGIRILDFTHFIAGPLATMFLADMGAEVIKVEKSGRGDDFRTFGPQKDGMGPPFVWTNRNKKSIALDLTKLEGQEIARELAAKSDVVVENFSAGVMQKFRLDYSSLRDQNRRLIYCAVSAYGRTGPAANRLGFDPVAQAESGFMSLTGSPNGPPTRSGPAIMDMSTAMMASNTILGALMARERIGEGQYVEVSLFDTAVLMSGFHSMLHLMTGSVPSRFGNSSPDSAPMDVFETADGPIYISCANDRSFHRLAKEVLGRPDLAEHPDYAEGKNRIPNKLKLAEILRPIFKTKTRAEWLKLMQPLGVPVGEVRDLQEVFSSPEIIDRDRVSSIPAASGDGHVPNISPPFLFGSTPVADPVAAPMVGQHTAQILAEVLQYDPDQITRLANHDVVHLGN